MGKKRILVVDDDIQMTRLLKVGLEKTGIFEVREVHRGRKALEAALKFNPDAILLDVFLPDVEGPEVAFQIASEPRLRLVPIIFLTGNVSERDLDKKGIVGGQRYIAKPARLDKIVAYLQNVLGLQERTTSASGCP